MGIALNVVSENWHMVSPGLAATLTAGAADGSTVSVLLPVAVVVIIQLPLLCIVTVTISPLAGT